MLTLVRVLFPFKDKGIFLANDLPYSFVRKREREKERKSAANFFGGSQTLGEKKAAATRSSRATGAFDDNTRTQRFVAKKETTILSGCWLPFLSFSTVTPR